MEWSWPPGNTSDLGEHQEPQALSAHTHTHTHTHTPDGCPHTQCLHRVLQGALHVAAGGRAREQLRGGGEEIRRSKRQRAPEGGRGRLRKRSFPASAQSVQQRDVAIMEGRPQGRTQAKRRIQRTGGGRGVQPAGTHTAPEPRQRGGRGGRGHRLQNQGGEAGSRTRAVRERRLTVTARGGQGTTRFRLTFSSKPGGGGGGVEAAAAASALPSAAAPKGRGEDEGGGGVAAAAASMCVSAVSKCDAADSMSGQPRLSTAWRPCGGGTGEGEAWGEETDWSEAASSKSVSPPIPTHRQTLRMLLLHSSRRRLRLPNTHYSLPSHMHLPPPPPLP